MLAILNVMPDTPCLNYAQTVLNNDLYLEQERTFNINNYTRYKFRKGRKATFKGLPEQGLAVKIVFLC